MSFLGNNFEYDFFVSYCWGQGNVDPNLEERNHIREWVKDFIGPIAAKLKTGLSTEKTARDLNFYFDFVDGRNSGSDIPDEIEEAVRSSAFLLIFMSPDYCRSDFCKREIEWFYDQAKKDGRGNCNFIIRQIVNTPHNPGDLSWPAALLDREGNPLHSGMPCYDSDLNNPVEIPEKLSAASRDVLREILEKLKKFKNQIEAAKTKAICGDEVAKQIYLQRHTDSLIWSSTKAELDKHVIVNPDKMDTELNDLNLLKSYNSRRRIALANCQGLVIVRKNSDDPSGLMISTSYEDRRFVKSSNGRELPWVLIDYSSDKSLKTHPLYKLPSVDASDSDWPSKALEALELD